MGHSYSGIFQFYINPNVKLDVQAAFLDQPSDEALMKLLGSMSLTCDPNAPTGLSPENAHAIQLDPKVMKLRERRDRITTALRRKREGDEMYNNVRMEELLQMKKDANAALNRKKKRLRDRAQTRTRKNYFMHNDTREIEEEAESGELFAEEETKPITTTYVLDERARIVDLLRAPQGNLAVPSNLDRRIKLITAFRDLCCRREVRRRGAAPESVQPQMYESDLLSSLPMECDPRQCIFCLWDPRLPVSQQTFCFSRVAKMMDHTEDQHLKGLAPDAKICCPDPRCRTGNERLILDGISHFKNHALRVHKNKLRIKKAG